MLEHDAKRTSDRISCLSTSTSSAYRQAHKSKCSVYTHSLPWDNTMKNKIELGKKPRQLSTPTHPMRYCSAHHINPAATASQEHGFDRRW